MLVEVVKKTTQTHQEALLKFLMELLVVRQLFAAFIFYVAFSTLNQPLASLYFR